jgi:hypothetical protein
MSASDEAVTKKLISSLELLLGLRKASFRSIVQAREALSQVHLLLIGSSASFVDAHRGSTKYGLLEFLETMNTVPMLWDFAAIALLQLQQQPVLQAPAADLSTNIMIVESLAFALQLPSSTPAKAKDLEQQTCEARTGATGCEQQVLLLYKHMLGSCTKQHTLATETHKHNYKESLVAFHNQV